MGTHFVGIVSTIALVAGTQPSIALAQPAPDEIAPVPAGIVVLVDESGSLTDADVEAERAATGLIAQSEFAADSSVGVLGFGGRNGRPGQSAVRVACEPKQVAAGQDRDYLAKCVNDLHRRSKEEGDDTDFPSALAEGLTTLNRMDGVRAKIVFLLTDGILNVDNDPAYGPDKESREAAARDRIRQLLAQANEAGVTIWPLGYGEARQGELDAFAAGGSQRTCGPNSPKPEARIAGSAEQVVASLADAYAAARCARSTPPSAAPLPPGGTVELPVDVPAIATDGSIAVHKTDPSIIVEYREPGGRVVPKAGRLGESRFEISGESTQVEVLRVRNPKPGTWLVRLTAPPGVGGRTVSAIVIWQGVVRATVTVEPQVPRPGENVTVSLGLHTRRGSLGDPALLGDITVVARVSGAGFEPRNVPLKLGGLGQFTSQVTIPDTASGAFEVLSMIGGPGIASDERPWTGQVNLGSADVRAQVRFDHRRIEPGATQDGQIEVSNDSATPRQVRLRLTDQGAHPGVTVSPESAEVAASGDTSIPFRLEFDQNARLGFGQAKLQVVDAADQDRAYGEKLLTFEVGYPIPPEPDLTPWIALLVLVLLIAVVAALTVRRRRAERDVRGLRAVLYRDDRQLAFLAAPDEPSPRFVFAVRDGYGDPRLDHATDPLGGYVARRGGGAIVLRTPDGGETRLRAGELMELASGLELAVADTRSGTRWDPDDMVPASSKPANVDRDGDLEL